MSRQIRLVRVVAGIIKQNNALLLAERPQGKPYAGYWEFPGGKVEANETDEAALKRELYEELGIVVTQAKPWFEYTYTYPDKTVLLAFWHIHEFSGEPQSKENQVLCWATLREMSSLPLLEGNKIILKELKQLLQSEDG